MAKKWVSCTTAVMVYAAFLGAASAQKKKAPKPAVTRVAVLPVEGKDLAGEVIQQLDAAVSLELDTIGLFTIIPAETAGTKIEQLKKKKIYVAGCANKPQCIKGVGRALRANILYHLVAVKAQEGITLNMRSFDMKTNKLVRQESEFATGEPGDLDRAAQWLTRKVSSPFITTLSKGKGKLEVQCNQEGADLYLNGKSFGKRTGKGFKVSAGVFDIVVKKEGFADFHNVVVVKADEQQTVMALLGGATPAVAAVEPKPTEAGVPPPVTKEEKPADLPAWAVFEKPKTATAPAGEKPSEQPETKKPWQAETKPPPPFLPEKKEEPVAAETSSRKSERFYETWWFWTIVGVGVVGAGGAAAIIALSGGGDAGAGNAIVEWE